MARIEASLFDSDGRPAGDVAMATRPMIQDLDEIPAPAIDRLIGGQLWRWMPLAGLWLAIAFLIAFGIYVSNTAQGRGVGLSWAMYATIPHFLAWAGLSPAIYRALFELVEGSRRALAVPLLAAWSFIALAASTIACYLGVALRDGSVPDIDDLIDTFVAPPFGPPYQAMNFSILLLALAAFGVVLALRQREHSRWEAARTSLREARQEAQLAHSRLQVLQSQINPHFLLNSLNSIADFVQSGKRDQAFDAVARLGGLLRTALRHGNSADVSLGDELDFAESYMQLLEMRFGRQFRFHLSMPEALRARRVPALITQPLIENSIRHGMRAQQTLTVECRAFTRDGRVVLEIEDDGRGFETEARPAFLAGHGLANVSERLKLYFGADARLQVAPRKPCGVMARIELPG